MRGMKELNRPWRKDGEVVNAILGCASQSAIDNIVMGMSRDIK